MDSSKNGMGIFYLRNSAGKGLTDWWHDILHGISRRKNVITTHDIRFDITEPNDVIIDIKIIDINFSCFEVQEVQ